MTGKKVSGDVYVHTSAVGILDSGGRRAYEDALSLMEGTAEALFNVVKIEQGEMSVSFLHYPSFFEEACPPLSQSWHVDLSTRRVSFRTYERSANPPILHRKELMLKSDDPRRGQLVILTSQLEAIGAFEQPLHIGFQRSWQRRLSQLGYCVVANDLLPLGNETAPVDGEINGHLLDGEVHRHRTALTRYALSAPVQLLYRVGLLSEGVSFFDYGCGKGSDVRLLTELGIEASGWDPHYAAESQRTSADVVNLGFVLNVIEDPAERNIALEQAFALARKVMAVAVMPTSNLSERAQPYRDGFITGRRTFQKYYSQPELRSYVESILGRETVAAVPGIVLVFKEDEAQVRYELSRLSRRATVSLPRLPRPPGIQASVRHGCKRRPMPSPTQPPHSLAGGAPERDIEGGRGPCWPAGDNRVYEDAPD